MVIDPSPIHTLIRHTWLLAVWVSLVGTGQLYGQSSIKVGPGGPLVVDSRFTTRPVNDRLLIYKGSAPEKQLLQSCQQTLPSSFLPNIDPRGVMVGPAYAYPQVWVYLPLVNPAGLNRKMVVDLDHNRCDTLDAYLLRAGREEPTHLGQLFRGLPLAQRAVPRRPFAIPFELAPYERAGLLLHSRRTTGIHELAIVVSTEAQFTINQDREAIVRLFALSSACFFTFTVFSLGLIFRHPLLVCFGIYGFAIVLGQLNFNYFFDDFPFPAWLGLTANSIGLFFIFTANCLFHCFGVAYFNSLNLYRGWHRYTVGLLVGANLTAMGTLLFPLTPLTNEGVTRASLILTTLNILWVFYISILAFSLKREKYLLITTTLVTIPLLYRTYGQETPALNYTYFDPLYYLLLFGFLIVALFRRELNSRQMTEEKIRLVQTEFTNLRQTEIEQIGRNLHDQLGNTLASVLGYLTLKEPKVGLAKSMILEAINETRMISHNLVKDDDRPLDDKLDELVERFNDFSPIRFAYHDFTEKKLNQLSPIKQQGIYMIVQEVLHNVVKHAQAREATIQAFLTESAIRVSVEDDGVGYVTNRESSGIGIVNMYKRAELARLTLAIDGGSSGTLVSIETPLAG